MRITVGAGGETALLDIAEAAFRYGVDKPPATSLQVPRSALTPVQGNVLFAGDGQVIEGLDISGSVDFGNTVGTALRNCLVRCGPVGTLGVTRPGIASYGSRASGRLVEFCEVDPDFPTVDSYGIVGYGFKAVRSSFVNVVDIANIYQGGDGTGAQLWGCYGETRQYDSDPRQGGKATHGDFAQVFGGTAVDLWGCNFKGVPQQANGIIFTPSTVDGVSAVVNPKVRDNWLSGCYTQISAWINPSGPAHMPISGLTIIGNRHAGSQGNPPADHRWDVLVTQENYNRRADISGNVRDPAGTAANLLING